MAEETKDWIGCPGAVKEQLPKKIQAAVNFAMDDCFCEIVGEPAAQRDKWLYKEIRKRICAAMHEWVQEALEDAMAQALEKEK